MAHKAPHAHHFFFLFACVWGRKKTPRNSTQKKKIRFELNETLVIPWMLRLVVKCLPLSGNERVYPPLSGWWICRAGEKMVKLGNNFSEKNNGKVVSEDGFDTIPLITPLDASQLQFPPPDKVRYHSEPVGALCLLFLRLCHYN